MIFMLGCTACGFDWDLPAGQLAAHIERFGALYRSRLDQLRDEHGPEWIRTRPDPQVWSPLEYTAHMRDVVDFYLDRIERILHEDRPQLDAIGFSRLAETRRYNTQDIDDVLNALNCNASTAAARLRSLSSSDWDRVGIGTDGDNRDVVVLARRLAHEGHHHLGDIRP